MRRVLCVAVCIMLAQDCAFAHLCNDVFAQAQAKDNLAVKVDIRDGQLRIGKEATFHVYLLNTMDRNIENINLAVLTRQFRATARPSASWKSFPVLKATRRGGKKEYFTVTLQRKKGIPDGRYSIRLRLYNARNSSMLFKTVDLNEASGLSRVPTTLSVKVDGKVTTGEWRKGTVCKGLYTYEKSGKYYVNKPAKQQTRFRLLSDEKNLYCLITFGDKKKATKDTSTIHLARTLDDKPLAIQINRYTGEVKCDKEAKGIVAKISKDNSAVECKIPLSVLGFKPRKAPKDGKKNTRIFLANFVRETTTGKRKTVSYWRGNSFSRNAPVVYGRFMMAQ